ncbi:MAG TPA: Gfo/Idh/MocA family oxidoreductase [Candidatus Acidoferrum sp.]|nr:Gfo/Idh/MocA family oxidoreductase [Candidatus Acidoferrum sp.]
MKTVKRVGYAVVGLGHIAEHAVLPAFRHAKKSRLIGLVSSDAGKARRLAKKFRAPSYCIYDRLEECLQNPEIEAVFIATNNSTHLGFTRRAAAAGKHVLCEKPLANTADECRQMIDACRSANVKLMTAYRKYFEPSSVALKQLIDSKKLGRLKLIHSAFTFNLPAQQVWHLKRELAGGGSLWDVGVYCVNAVRWLTGLEPVEATAYSWSADPQRFKEVDESIAFQLRFPDGLFVQASSSFAAAKASFIQIHAEKGWVAVDPAFAYNEKKSLFGQIDGKWFSKEFPPSEEFHIELDHLADCIRANLEPEPDGTTGMRDVAVMEAIYEAAKLGRTVPITCYP